MITYAARRGGNGTGPKGNVTHFINQKIACIAYFDLEVSKTARNPASCEKWIETSCVIR